MIQLDIVIPVYNEGDTIASLLEDVRRHVKTPYRILICYDFDEDNTLSAIDSYHHRDKLLINFVKNIGAGPNMAVISGIQQSNANFQHCLMLLYPCKM